MSLAATPKPRRAKRRGFLLSVGASLLAMVVNDNAGILDTCVPPTIIASRLAPTGKIKIIERSPESIVENKFQKLPKRDIKPL